MYSRKRKKEERKEDRRRRVRERELINCYLYSLSLLPLSSSYSFLSLTPPTAGLKPAVCPPGQWAGDGETRQV